MIFQSECENPHSFVEIKRMIYPRFHVCLVVSLVFLLASAGASAQFSSSSTGSNVQLLSDSEEADYQRRKFERDVITKASAAVGAADSLISNGTDLRRCRQAMALIQQGLDLLAELPAAIRTGNRTPWHSASLVMGLCRMELEDYPAAEHWLTIASGRGDAYTTPRALACLGDIYARGLGVPVDKARAAGLLIASNGWCPVTETDSKRDAAEILLTLNPGASWDSRHTALQLLSSGPPKNWLRAVQVIRTHYPQAQYTMATVFGGIRAGERTDIWQDEENRAAVRELNLAFGNYHLGQGNYAVAYDALKTAASPDAAGSLALLQKKLLYRLVLSDGRIWSAADVQR